MHTIRLRGPWQLEPVFRHVLAPDGSWTRELDYGDELPAACHQTMPADWSASLGTDFLGSVRYRRTFQRPTNLQPNDWVWLVVEPPRSSAGVHLGHHYLGSVCSGQSAARFEVNSLLEDRNELTIFVSHPLLDGAGDPPDDGSVEAPGGLVGEVRLEITEGSEAPGHWTRV